MAGKISFKTALAHLKAGNEAYVASNHIDSQDKSSFVDENGNKGQWPYAIILSCADSRVCPENLFFEEEGELFVCRVAGNISNTDTLASIEYAVSHPDIPISIIVVLGHEGCGAVGAAVKFYDQKAPTKALEHLVAQIRPAIKPKWDDKKNENANAKNAALSMLRKSKVIRNANDSGELGIITGHYKIYGKKAGKVSWGKKISLSKD